MTHREKRRFKKNRYIEKEGHFEIHIYDLKENLLGVGLIDKEWVVFCKKYTWRIYSGYLHTTINRKNIALHRLVISDIEKGNVRDHINRNRLDNRRQNLRETSCSVNSTNSKPRSESTTGIRGVMYCYKNTGSSKYDKNHWYAEWSVNGVRRTRWFSVKKYGYDKAKEMAINFRKEKLKEMKI